MASSSCLNVQTNISARPGLGRWSYLGVNIYFWDSLIGIVVFDSCLSVRVHAYVREFIYKQYICIHTQIHTHTYASVYLPIHLSIFIHTSISLYLTPSPCLSLSVYALTYFSQ